MSSNTKSNPLNTALYLLLAAIIMAYGWGYRGTVGHEGGAMVPGALLGLALCIASGRLDWQRRAAVAGLFAAIGWSWGGSLSYMEQTFYVASDSFIDVAYGYATLFFLGALWAGLGGGALGLALTESRSELERLIRPFTVVCGAYFVAYLAMLFNPDLAQAYETITVNRFHDGDWLAATLGLAASCLYWLANKKDRPATILFVAGSIAWWIGYGGLTKLGGLRLGPLHRSESWGGVLGLLVVLVIYLLHRKNRAALMMCLYGILGGGLAFSFAVMFRHPMLVHWGPFQGSWPQWRTAEDTFGFCMGLAVALGAIRLLRGGLRPADEDTPRARLDVYAVFTILVVLVWMNFRRHADPHIIASDKSATPDFLGYGAWVWFSFGGVLAALPVVIGLWLYLRGNRQLTPPTALGKAVIIALALIWVTVAGGAADTSPRVADMSGWLLLWVPAGLASLLLMHRVASPESVTLLPEKSVPADDKLWRVGPVYWGLWILVPVFIFGITSTTMAMQDGPLAGHARKRFGAEAYWRMTANLMGDWKVMGISTGVETEIDAMKASPFTTVNFNDIREVTVVLPDGSAATRHQWFLKNQYIWMRWEGLDKDKTKHQEVPLEFRGDKLFVALPKTVEPGGFLVLQKQAP